jgi:hypothetical protein
MSEVRFTSPIASLKIWIDPTYVEWVNNRPRPVMGKKVQFDKGLLVLDSEKDADTIDFLRHDSLYNTNRGFYEDMETRPKDFWPTELLDSEEESEEENFESEVKTKVKTKKR